DCLLAALLFHEGVLASLRDGEVDRLVDDVLDDGVVPLVAPGEGASLRDGNERLLQLHQRVHGEIVAGKGAPPREPGEVDELPGVVAALADEEVAIDDELQLE